MLTGESRSYETIVVLDPNLNESDLKDEVKKVQTILENKGALDVKADSWGKKEISYLVRKQQYGNFVCYNYRSEAEPTIKDITAILGITEKVIKFQTHRKADRSRKFKGNPKRKDPVDLGDDFDGLDSSY